MKLLLLYTLFALAATAQTTTPPAQVPAHSVVGSLTIDVVDSQVNLPSGDTLTGAVISVCTDQQVARVQITVTFPDVTPGLGTYANYDVPMVKVGNGYCASVLSAAPRVNLLDLSASAAFLAHIAPTAGSTAAQRH